VQESSRVDLRLAARGKTSGGGLHCQALEGDGGNLDAASLTCAVALRHATHSSSSITSTALQLPGGGETTNTTRSE
jgi:hypothetical protein